MAAEMSGENVVQNDEEIGHDDQRLIIFDDPPGATEEVATSEPSTSVASESSTSFGSLRSAVSAASWRSAIESVGPLRYKGPRPKSNRGPKPMKTAVLTSPEQASILRERAKKRKENEEKKGSKKAKPSAKSKPNVSSSSSPSETDFCIICLKQCHPNAQKTIRLHAIHASAKCI